MVTFGMAPWPSVLVFLVRSNHGQLFLLDFNLTLKVISAHPQFSGYAFLPIKAQHPARSVPLMAGRRLRTISAPLRRTLTPLSMD